MLLLSMAFAQQVESVTAGLVDDSLNTAHDIPVALAAPVETATPEPPVVEAPLPTESDVAGFTVDQVFAEEQGLTAAPVAIAPSNGFGGSLGWVVGIAGLGLAFAGRKFVNHKLTKAPEQQRLEVLDRKGLGANSSLMLVEVETTEGGRRRLLVGTGQGAPTLVADLGGDIPGFPIPENLDAPLGIELPAPPEPVAEPKVETPPSRFSGKFTDEDLAQDDAPAPAKPTVDPVAGRSRNAALATMARNSSSTRAPLGKRPFAASPWSKTVDRMPKSPTETASRLENRKSLVADVLKGRAA